ncbi:MAG: ParB/RepB/Spo0J family partition protein [Betaproteobacteria bacterium]|nr:ParB/RepB/Spo0J family partition protein [Betaproteobacteria bacterium]
MKRGLGRGLDKLLGAAAESSAPHFAAPLQIPVGNLRAGKFQPRRRFDKEDIKSLADSIRKQGVIQPLVIRPAASGGYEIIAGERRWRAAQIAGLKTVPAVARAVSDREAMLFALAENIQRADLNSAEQARGIARLLEETKMTHAEAAESLGLSRAGVTNLLRLLSLSPPVLQLLGCRCRQ